MSESVWGRFSAFTDQLSQLTREVIADDDVEEDEDVLEENEDQETHEDLGGAQQTQNRQPASLEDSAFFGEEDGREAADEGDEVAQLKSVIARQKREVPTPTHCSESSRALTQTHFITIARHATHTRHTTHKACGSTEGVDRQPKQTAEAAQGKAGLHTLYTFTR
jgi:hypothetical protein